MDSPANSILLSEKRASASENDYCNAEPYTINNLNLLMCTVFLQKLWLLCFVLP